MTPFYLANTLMSAYARLDSIALEVGPAKFNSHKETAKLVDYVWGCGKVADLLACGAKESAQSHARWLLFGHQTDMDEAAN